MLYGHFSFFVFSLGFGVNGFWCPRLEGNPWKGGDKRVCVVSKNDIVPFILQQPPTNCDPSNGFLPTPLFLNLASLLPADGRHRGFSRPLSVADIFIIPLHSSAHHRHSA